MKKTLAIFALTIAAAVALSSPALAKKRHIDLRESDPWFGPAVRPAVSPQQVVIYGRTFPAKPRTAYERMMDHGEL